MRFTKTVRRCENVFPIIPSDVKAPYGSTSKQHDSGHADAWTLSWTCFGSAFSPCCCAASMQGIWEPGPPKNWALAVDARAQDICVSSSLHCQMCIGFIYSLVCWGQRSLLTHSLCLIINLFKPLHNVTVDFENQHAGQYISFFPFLKESLWQTSLLATDA